MNTTTLNTSRVIARKRLPVKLPIYGTAVLYLLLDNLAAAQWVWGACITFAAVHWLVSLYLLLVQEQVDVLSIRGRFRE